MVIANILSRRPAPLLARLPAMLPAVLCALLALALGCVEARAQAVVSTGQSFVTARLVPGAPAADGGRVAGLALDLADGWKTYWRSPGEAGVPPVFDWSASTNLREVRVLWPTPELFESFGMQTVGYAHQVTLPVEVVAEDPTRPVELRLKASLGVCRELCVLEEIELSDSIAAGEVGGAAEVAAALDALPDDAAESGLSDVTCRITGAGPERRLEAQLRFARPLSAPVVLVEGPETVWIGETETTVDGGDLGVTATVAMLEPGAWIGRGDLRMTVLDGAFAADIQGCAAPGN